MHRRAQRESRSSAHEHYSFSWPRPRNEKHESTSGEGSYDRGPAPETHHNLHAASAFAISFRTPYLWNGTTKKRYSLPVRMRTVQMVVSNIFFTSPART